MLTGIILIPIIYYIVGKIRNYILLNRLNHGCIIQDAAPALIDKRILGNNEVIW